MLAALRVRCGGFCRGCGGFYVVVVFGVDRRVDLRDRTSRRSKRTDTAVPASNKASEGGVEEALR